MTIYFVAIESGDQAYYDSALKEHDLVAVSKLAEVDADAEFLSIFLDEKIDDTFLKTHPKLKMIATRSTSWDHFDLEACRARGVEICHVPYYGEEAAAEHTFALMLALARRLRELMNLPKKGRFSYEKTRSFELHGKTLGIIGMGKVGQRVAKLAGAFDMQVLACDIDRREDLSTTLKFEWASLDDLLARSDVVTLHAPLTSATYHIINEKTFAQMKRGVLIVNTARGSLIDTAALRTALETGQVGGAGLDVLQDERVLRRSAPEIITTQILKHLRSDDLAHEAHDADRIRELEELVGSENLLSRSNVVFTPHVAFNTHEAVERLRAVTANNIRAYIAGTPQNVVPIPQVAS